MDNSRPVQRGLESESKRGSFGWRRRRRSEGVATAWEDATTLITPGSIKKKRIKEKNEVGQGEGGLLVTAS